MKHPLYILTLVAICLTSLSCIKKAMAEEPDSAVLTERTTAIIELFLDNTKQWRDGKEQLSLTGRMDKNEKGYFYLHICADDTAVFKPYGECKGVVHVRGNSILLFGDSWNDYFWSSDTTYSIPNHNPENEFVFYDPSEWYLVIRTQDTTLNPTFSDVRYPVSDLTQFTEIMSETPISLDILDSILKQ